MTRSQHIEGRTRGRALRRIAAVVGLACLLACATTACGGRTLVGRIWPRTISIGDAHITITASVPREIRGTDKLRVRVASERSGSLRGVDFTLDGRAVRHHARSVALTAQQLDDDTRVLSIVLHPTHGSDVTVRIPLRTRATA
jgi:hypothetical protein